MYSLFKLFTDGIGPVLEEDTQQDLKMALEDELFAWLESEYGCVVRGPKDTRYDVIINVKLRKK